MFPPVLRTVLTRNCTVRIASRYFSFVANINNAPQNFIKRNELKAHIKASLSDPKTLKSPIGILDLLTTALNSEVELSVTDYINGIYAATEVKGFQCDIAFRLYDLYKVKSTVPVECYSKLFRVCLNRDNADKAKTLFVDYEKCGYPVTESVLSCLILVLAKTVCDDHLNDLHRYFVQLKDLLAEKRQNSLVKSNLYIQVATFYCRLHKSDLALSALEDMTEADHEPTAVLCAPLLDSALFVSDSGVLRVLASWYVNNFSERLEKGVINRMLQVAAIAGDDQLAHLSFQIINKNSYTYTANNFCCLIRACLLNCDLISAVEALQLMELKGVVFNSNEDCGDHKQIESLRELMVNALSQSGDTLQLDELYFALVDQAKGGGSVPRIALDAIVETSGRLDLNDRAFATFLEYQPVFRLQPDIHSYNALLASCGYARTVVMHTMLSVFEKIDQSNSSSSDPLVDGNQLLLTAPCKPNEQSFSLLLEAMVDSGDFRVFDEVLSFMRQSGIRASSRSLRRVLMSCTKRNEIERVDHLVDLLQTQEGRGLSRHFKARMSLIRNNFHRAECDELLHADEEISFHNDSSKVL